MSKPNAVMIAVIFALLGPLTLWLGGYNFDQRNSGIAFFFLVWTAVTIWIWSYPYFLGKKGGEK